MKITIITAAMTAGGAQRVISQLLNEWNKRGIECSLILLENKEVFYKIPSNVKICKIKKTSSNSYVDKFLKYKEVRRIVKKIKPDVVLSLPEEVGIYVIAALLGTHVPVIVSERNNPWVMPNKKITRILRKVLYPFADGFIFQTKKAASFFNKNIQKKGIILDNPLDLSRIPDVYDGKREKSIVSVGRLEPQKNFELLINTFSIFHGIHPDYNLIIYGEGSERQKIEKLVKKKELEEFVSLPGTAQDVLVKIRSASMFVLTSNFEGVPNALIEAIAVGLPCVTTDCEPGGARHIIKNDIKGIIVPINNEEELLKAMLKIANNPIEIESILENSKKIKQRMNSEIVANQWMDYIKKII